MSVLVEFPDGTCREVPSQLRAIPSEQSTGPAEFEKIPLNCDSQWKYHRDGARWIAIHRNGQLLPLRHSEAAWWHVVAVMNDPECSLAHATPSRKVELQSAA